MTQPDTVSREEQERREASRRRVARQRYERQLQGMGFPTDQGEVDDPTEHVEVRVEAVAYRWGPYLANGTRRQGERDQVTLRMGRDLADRLLALAVESYDACGDDPPQG